MPVIYEDPYTGSGLQSLAGLPKPLPTPGPKPTVEQTLAAAETDDGGPGFMERWVSFLMGLPSGEARVYDDDLGISTRNPDYSGAQSLVNAYTGIGNFIDQALSGSLGTPMDVAKQMGKGMVETYTDPRYPHEDPAMFGVDALGWILGTAGARGAVSRAADLANEALAYRRAVPPLTAESSLESILEPATALQRVGANVPPKPRRDYNAEMWEGMEAAPEKPAPEPVAPTLPPPPSRAASTLQRAARQYDIPELKEAAAVELATRELAAAATPTTPAAPAEAISVSTSRMRQLLTEHPDEYVYVGRNPDKWVPGLGQRDIFGNPDFVPRGGSTEAAVAKYRALIEARAATDPAFAAEVKALAGKKLMCFPGHSPCHAEALADLANKLNGYEPPTFPSETRGIVTIMGSEDTLSHPGGRLVVTGSRHGAKGGWPNPEAVKAAIRKDLAALPPDTLVVHGGASGVDTWIDEAAKARGLQVEPHLVTAEDWARSRRAGIERNIRMMDTNPRTIYAVWNPEGPGGTTNSGTIAAVSEAVSRGIQVKVRMMPGASRKLFWDAVNTSLQNWHPGTQLLQEGSISEALRARGVVGGEDIEARTPSDPFQAETEMLARGVQNLTPEETRAYRTARSDVRATGETWVEPERPVITPYDPARGAFAGLGPTASDMLFREIYELIGQGEPPSSLQSQVRGPLPRRTGQEILGETELLNEYFAPAWRRTDMRAVPDDFYTGPRYDADLGMVDIERGPAPRYESALTPAERALADEDFIQNLMEQAPLGITQADIDAVKAIEESRMQVNPLTGEEIPEELARPDMPAIPTPPYSKGWASPTLGAAEGNPTLNLLQYKLEMLRREPSTPAIREAERKLVAQIDYLQNPRSPTFSSRFAEEGAEPRGDFADLIMRWAEPTMDDLELELRLTYLRRKLGLL